MEDSFFDKMPGLQKLLETKSFSELTAKEKDEVLIAIGQDEYDACHAVITESKVHFAKEQKELVPDPAILRNLLKKMESRRSRQNPVLLMLQKLFTFRMPVYQPAFVLAFFAVLLFVQGNRKHETIRYLAMTDTVYFEKQIPAAIPPGNQSIHPPDAPAVNTVKTTSYKHSHSAAGTDTTGHSPNDQYIKNAYQKIQLAALLKRGHPAFDDSALMKFLVVAN
jgi:hypothetical protein